MSVDVQTVLAYEAGIEEGKVKSKKRIAALEDAVKSMLHFNGDCACTACVAGHTILREGK